MHVTVNSGIIKPIWPKINRFLPLDHMNLYTKFHENRIKRIRDIVLTDRHTDRQTFSPTHTLILETPYRALINQVN